MWTVLALAAGTALATGVGALPFAFFMPTRRWLGVGNAVAAGLMLAASASLIIEGHAVGPGEVLGGVVLGGVFILLSHRWLAGRGHLDVAGLKGADARKALLLVGAMTVHSAAEGIGIGVSFGGGAELGLFISVAIAVHNIPEGLAISLVLVPRGVSTWRAAGWSVFSSLPQPLLAVPAFIFVLQFGAVLSWGLGFAAGAMIWMVVTDLIPDALRDAGGRAPVAAGVVISALGMALLQIFLKG
ncbi:MAG: ZIP family metal transporter [Gemmatimonadota bacterium]